MCQEHEDEDAFEDDDLNLTEGDRQKLKKQFKTFNLEVNIDNPSFKLGTVFSGVEEVRMSLGTYCIRNRVQSQEEKEWQQNVRTCVCSKLFLVYEIIK